MTGFGSPCGACKFLRRKCVRGCIFAPYFCHEQGAAHFAAIHKVFGASNVSKLLMHLPVPDRCEAAVTIAYEAQARLQDPIYGCVAHIFALQQQVVNLQAELASLKAQTTQGYQNGSTSTSSPQEEKFYNKFHSYPQDAQSFFQTMEVKTTESVVSNPLMGMETMLNTNHGLLESNFYQTFEDLNPNLNTTDENVSFSSDDNSSCGMSSFDMEDLRSVAYAYLHRS